MSSLFICYTHLRKATSTWQRRALNPGLPSDNLLLYHLSYILSKACPLYLVYLNFVILFANSALWWIFAERHNYFAIFPTHYLTSNAMTFGLMVAGANSEGGGALAFPVMTLVLKLSPSIAGDFSLMCQ